MAIAKTIGQGWHNQSVRHSNARRFGRAGGKYSRYTPTAEGKRGIIFSKRVDDDVIKDMYYYRLIWNKTTGKGQNGLFEKFMVSAFPERKEPYYAKEWAERFATGNPTTYMDDKRKKIYLELLEKNDVYDEDLFPKKDYAKGEREKTEEYANLPFRNKKEQRKYGKTFKIKTLSASFDSPFAQYSVEKKGKNVVVSGEWDEGNFTINKVKGGVLSKEELTDVEEKLQDYRNEYTDGTW